jgi:hypothetical protein
MDCRYCHRTVEEGAAASIPDAATCYGCHQHVKKDSFQLESLRAQFVPDAPDDHPVEWIKVHLLPDYAYFNHSVHIAAQVGCKSCHGRVDQMEIVRQVEPLSMGWCLACHRDPAAHIRPLDVSVTNMTWEPNEASKTAAMKLLDWDGDNVPKLNPPTHCSACHR